MSNHSHELFGPDGQQPTVRPASCEFALRALTAALQTAFEAAARPDWFEIDEQAPASRIDALTEALILQLQEHAGNHPSREKDIHAMTAIIQRIGARTRTISKRQKDHSIRVPRNEFFGPR